MSSRLARFPGGGADQGSFAATQLGWSRRAVDTNRPVRLLQSCPTPRPPASGLCVCEAVVRGRVDSATSVGRAKVLDQRDGTARDNCRWPVRSWCLHRREHGASERRAQAMPKPNGPEGADLGGIDAGRLGPHIGEGSLRPPPDRQEQRRAVRSTVGHCLAPGDPRGTRLRRRRRLARRRRRSALLTSSRPSPGRAAGSAFLGRVAGWPRRGSGA